MSRDPLAALESSVFALLQRGSTVDDRPDVPGVEVLDKLAEGGMATVWLATEGAGEDTRELALKVYGAGPALAARVRTEFSIVHGLDHPGIARVLRCGEDRRGHAYLVMELVDGRAIHHHCRVHRLNTRQRVELFLKVCDAVQYAHRHLVVHRDLKPDNVLVTAAGVPKLLDFGVAKALDSEGGSPTVTLLQQRALTPAYASPEQLSGAPVTTASDIYSLGIMLCELLCGRRPYDLSGVDPAGLPAALQRITPRRPSELAAETKDYSPAVRSLRGDLDNIVLQALRLDPDRRYASVEHFREDLRRYLVGEPVHARGDAWWYRTRRFARRHWVASSFAALALVSTTSMSVALARQADSLRHERDTAKEMARAADARRLQMVQSISVMSGLLYRAVDMGEIDIERLAELGKHELTIGPDTRKDVAGEVLQSLLRISIHSNKPKLASELAQEVETLARGEDIADIDRADALHHVLSALIENGEYKRAIHIAREMVELRIPLNAAEHWQTVRGKVLLAGVLRTLGHYEESVEVAREAYEASVVDDSPPRIDKAAVTLAAALTGVGQFDEAEALLDRVIDDGTRPASALLRRGDIWLIRGDANRALDDYSEALRTSTSSALRKATFVASVDGRRARALLLRGDIEHARRLAGRSLHQAKGRLRDEHPDLADFHEILATIAESNGRLAIALNHGRSAQKIWSQELGDSHPYTRRIAKWLHTFPLRHPGFRMVEDGLKTPAPDDHTAG